MFPLYKTKSWNEEIAMASTLSGSNIVARYYSQKRKKNNNDKKEMKCKKIERYEKVRNLKQISGINDDEKNSLLIESPLLFFISNNSSINSHLEIESTVGTNFPDYIDLHMENGFTKLINWIKTHK